jgi:hypothetical protein
MQRRKKVLQPFRKRIGVRGVELRAEDRASPRANAGRNEVKSTRKTRRTQNTLSRWYDGLWDCHFCPEGHEHTLVNDGDEPLVFYAVVPAVGKQ